jgi:hypothetical protein
MNDAKYIGQRVGHALEFLFCAARSCVVHRRSCQPGRATCCYLSAVDSFRGGEKSGRAGRLWAKS